jgi:hypothetical protein
MKKAFNSNNFVFRPTGMSDAFSQAGLVKTTLVREEKIHLLARANHDKGNVLPSVSIHLTPAKA